MSIPVRERLGRHGLLQHRGTGIPLTPKEMSFVWEYSIDHNAPRASVTVGVSPTRGSQWLNEPHIQEAIGVLYVNQMRPEHLTASVLKEEMYKNHLLAQQRGDLNQSNKALDMLAKHAHIDAYAAQKVSYTADVEIAQRLREGRMRSAASTKDEEDFL